MENTCYSCQILMKLELSLPVVEKYSNIRFHENASSDSQVVPCRQMDRRRDRQTWQS